MVLKKLNGILTLASSRLLAIYEQEWFKSTCAYILFHTLIFMEERYDDGISKVQ